jgi:hypothetical protein
VTGVSVVLPLYNAEPHIGEAVRSVLEQTHRDFEFIVVDDGSHDGSAAVVDGFSDSRLRVIRQANAGLVAALNRGIQEASNEYVARMDHDDVSHPQRLACQARVLDESPDVALVASCYAVLGEGRVQRVEHVPSRTDQLARQLFFRNVVPHGGAMFRRSVVLGLGGYRQVSPCEDYDLWTRVLQEHKVTSIPRVLFGYRLSAGGMSAAAPVAQRECTRTVRSELWSRSNPARSTAKTIRADIAELRRRHALSAASAYRAVAFDQLGIARQDVSHNRALSGLQALAALAAGSARALRGTTWQAAGSDTCVQDLAWWAAR